MSNLATNFSPFTHNSENFSVSLELTTPPNPSPAYRGMLETLTFLKNAATLEIFSALSADFIVNDETVTFTAAFPKDLGSRAVEFLVYMETLLRFSVAGKVLTDEERWKRITGLAESFNERGWDGWGIVHQMFDNDAIDALGALEFTTQEDAMRAIPTLQRLVNERVCIGQRKASGKFSVVPESHLTAVQQ